MNRACAMWLVGFVASLNLVATGCGGGSYPHVRAIGDSEFMSSGKPVVTVDVLPIDIQLWTYRGNKKHPQVIADQFRLTTSGAIQASLAKRGYQVVAHVDWNGNYVTVAGRPEIAMSRSAMAETTYALSGYGEAQASHADELLIPHLPVRLGIRTGSDSTLYVGGWAYAGKDGGSTGKKVAKGILIAVLVVVVVAVIVLAVAGGGKGGGGKLGKVAGGAGKAAGKAASGVGKVAGRMVGGAAKVAGHVGRVTVRGFLRSARSAGRLTIDAFGRADTHIELFPGRPDYYKTDVPRKGRSAMMLEMILIDNHTGTTLWHARQRFRASPDRPQQVSRAVEAMISTMPRSTGQAPSYAAR